MYVCEGVKWDNDGAGGEASCGFATERPALPGERSLRRAWVHPCMCVGIAPAMAARVTPHLWELSDLLAWDAPYN